MVKILKKDTLAIVVDWKIFAHKDALQNSKVLEAQIFMALGKTSLSDF